MKLISAAVLASTAFARGQYRAAQDVPTSDVLPSEYLVVLKPESDARSVAASLKTAGVSIRRSVDVGTFHMVSAVGVSQNVLQSVLLAHDSVAYVEPNQVAHLAVEPALVQQQQCELTDLENCSWGLDRVDGRLDAVYTWDSGSAGEGTTVYVLDTGVNWRHSDFEGRARYGYDFVDDGNADASETDCHGHGTHCAGTIASATWGVAKKAEVVGVRVMGCLGAGSYDNIMAGINFAVEEGGDVISMSIGGGFSQALNDAVEAAYDAGTFVVSAAGNSFVDACNTSPAGAEKSFTVCASAPSTDGLDRWATYSNHGNCTEVIAPGTTIISTNNSPWRDSAVPSGYQSMTGTSMACPHVAGVAAVYASQLADASPDNVWDAMLDNATPWTGELDDINGDGTPQVVSTTLY